MEFLEAVGIFPGWNYRVLHGTAFDCFVCRRIVLRDRFYDDHFIIVRKLIFGDPVSGWPSLVCIILMTSGVQFFCTGILGQYLAKAYMEVKRRPIYLVKEEI